LFASVQTEFANNLRDSWTTKMVSDIKGGSNSPAAIFDDRGVSDGSREGVSPVLKLVAVSQ